MDKFASEVPFRYSDYYSGRENVGREQTGIFVFSRERKEMKTLYLARNRRKKKERKKKNSLRKNLKWRRQELGAGHLTQNVKVRPAGLRDQGQSPASP